MVQLHADDMQTSHTADWKGVHLFHYLMSSCSQKLRMVLRWKDVDWQPHEVNLAALENCEPWFLAINPRGLVPVLVLDGDVHIESNDIIEVLEDRFPEPSLIPLDRTEEVRALLKAEDDLHLDLRRLSFRFVHGRTQSNKSPDVLQAYRDGGTGTVQGQADPHKQVEVAFYEELDTGGLSDAACRASAETFRAAFDEHEQRLAKGPYLLGDTFSVIDIAWFVYAYRLTLGGYPLARLHPTLNGWFERLGGMSELTAEVAMPETLQQRIAANRKAQEAAGKTLSEVAGF